ncbi:polysaccharide pyruvyl transferase family protein [Histidinibacterium lentulum]|uniref:Polysaccharide pyruvyl transferase family protein n=1 Tax=Histidinibacterium lentulum TaxID=2480588 RepID=A0A3N2RA32_9RHOB|nr:polysaccharide pyruvyl transferase family protein [Histidinibacterium lentulum]ROU04329.1 polysaccharide pyruvyl transferase family protein [Histidinibacterium lentulum]
MITLLNAAPDTGNQGVSALCHSVVAGLWSRGARELTVADHGRGLRPATLGGARVNLMGLTHHKRLWRGDNLRTSHVLLRMGVARSVPARVVSGSRAVLDISGGDSFTDVYGPKRFRAMILTKRLALDAGVPLILLPQKLGPFRNPTHAAEAVEVLGRAAAVWVRDQDSFTFLQWALGEAFDPERHRLGVDVAVALPGKAPEGLDRETMDWLSAREAEPIAGLNVSGLLCNDAPGARRAFGLAADHTDQIEATARALLTADKALRLLLVPHVHRPGGDAESDLDAARALKARLGAPGAGRVRVLEERLSATELKWVLSRLDWFAGARMHATIGAFSSGVPTLGLGYTDKARGVFAECGIEDKVADLRNLDARAVAARAAASYAGRHARRVDLARRIAGLRARAASEMDVIARQAGL